MLKNFVTENFINSPSYLFPLFNLPVGTEKQRTAGSFCLRQQSADGYCSSWIAPHSHSKPFLLIVISIINVTNWDYCHNSTALQSNIAFGFFSWGLLLAWCNLWNHLAQDLCWLITGTRWCIQTSSLVLCPYGWCVATDVCVSRCQRIDDASAAIFIKELQDGGNEPNPTWENLMCKKNTVVLTLDGFIHSLVNLAQNSY